MDNSADPDFLFAGGEGTSDNPFRIATVEQLQNMEINLSAYYVLVNDIDASETRSWSGGAGFEPVGNNSNKFTGSLDGQGYNITGLYIYRPSQNYVGLFGHTTQMTNFENISLIDNNVTGGSSVGGLIGYNFQGTLTQCYATGNVTGSGNVGGLVGYNLKGTITQCYATSNVTGSNNVGGLVGYNNGNLTQCYATGNVTGNNDVGGLIGYSFQGTLTQCYATGNVTGSDTVGGLVGDNYDTLTQCYATGNVTGSDTVGGLVAYNYRGTLTQCYATGNVTGSNNVGGLAGYNNGNLTQCYWDKETTGQTTSDGSDPSYGKETGDMKTESTYVGWDFTGGWAFCDEATAS